MASDRGGRGPRRRGAGLPRLPAASPRQARAGPRRAPLRDRRADAVPAGHEGPVRLGRRTRSPVLARLPTATLHRDRGRRPFARAVAQGRRGRGRRPRSPRSSPASCARLRADAAEASPRPRVLPGARACGPTTHDPPMLRAGPRRPATRSATVGGREALPMPGLRSRGQGRCRGTSSSCRWATLTPAAIGTPSAGAASSDARGCIDPVLPGGSRRRGLRCGQWNPPSTDAADACIPVSGSKRPPCDACGHPMEPEHAHYRCPACHYILPCCGW